MIPLDEQDRSLWNRDAIDEGTGVLVDALSSSHLGTYQVQAAIAAVHDESPDAAATDWDQILALYDLLSSIAPGPVVALNRVVAVAEARDVAAGFAALEHAVDAHPELVDSARTFAVRGHLLAARGDHADAKRAFGEAADRTDNLRERAHLLARADREHAAQRSRTSSAAPEKSIRRRPPEFE